MTDRARKSGQIVLVLAFMLLGLLLLALVGVDVFLASHRKNRLQNAGDNLSTGTLVSRMGSYLETEHEADTKGILDFALWDSDKLGWSADEPGGENAELTIHVWQRRPLYGSEEEDVHQDLHEVRGEAGIESHF